MANSAKICPFIKQACIVGNCEIFNTTLNRCNISVLPYNIYRLTEALRSSPASPSDQPFLFGKILDMDQKPIGPLV